MQPDKVDISITQYLALEDMTKGPLVEYRRGYARSKLGPFYSERTIKSLQRKGFVTATEKGSKVRATRAGLDRVRTANDNFD